MRNLLCLMLFLVVLTFELKGFENYHISHLDLGDLCPRASSRATCVNNKGEVTGVLNATNPSRSVIFFWKKEDGLTELFDCGLNPDGINDFGSIVGEFYKLKEPYYFYYIWTLQKGLHELGDFKPTALNNQNVIVGSLISRNSGVQKWNASYTTWPDRTTTSLSLVHKLNLKNNYPYGSFDSYCQEIPEAINENNEIVGGVKFSTSSISLRFMTHAFYYKDGTAVDLGSSKHAKDINNNSQVILNSVYSIENKRGVVGAWLWEPGRELVLLWKSGEATAINNHGVIVGYKRNNVDIFPDAVIWENGEVSKLLDLVENKKGWESLQVAYDINDQGTIVGVGYYLGKETAFIMKPIKQE